MTDPKGAEMHYSTQHDLARGRLDDLLKEAETARLAALAREDGKPRFSRLSGLLERLQRQRAHRPATAAS
jgi:hypothetical protein